MAEEPKDDRLAGRDLAVSRAIELLRGKHLSKEEELEFMFDRGLGYAIAVLKAITKDSKAF